MAKKSSEEKKYVEATRTIRIVSRAPLDAQHYPDMTGVQAVDYELRLPREEKIELFVEELGNVLPGDIELTETVRIVD